MEAVRKLLGDRVVACVSRGRPQLQIVLLENTGGAEVVEAVSQNRRLVARRGFLLGEHPAQDLHFRATDRVPLADDNRLLRRPDLRLDEG